MYNYHLVEDPIPSNYQTKILKNLKVKESRGIATIYAYGQVFEGAWRVGTATETEVVSEGFFTNKHDLLRFTLRGAKQGMDLALYHYGDKDWEQVSDFAVVDFNGTDQFAEAKSNDKLPKSSYCDNIYYYPFGAELASPAMPEILWMNNIEEAIKLVAGNKIGKTVLANLPKTVISPYMPSAPNAWSDVRINPMQWKEATGPCTRLDEIILHELIHRIDRSSESYGDRYGFAYDNHDFLTVNATNVYSCMLGRGLRKDHRGFNSLPSEHFNNPKLHWEQQKPNYKIAESGSPALVKTLKEIKNVWNPFIYLNLLTF